VELANWFETRSGSVIGGNCPYYYRPSSAARPPAKHGPIYIYMARSLFNGCFKGPGGGGSTAALPALGAAGPLAPCEFQRRVRPAPAPVPPGRHPGSVFSTQSNCPPMALHPPPRTKTVLRYAEAPHSLHYLNCRLPHAPKSHSHLHLPLRPHCSHSLTHTHTHTHTSPPAFHSHTHPTHRATPTTPPPLPTNCHICSPRELAAAPGAWGEPLPPPFQKRKEGSGPLQADLSSPHDCGRSVIASYLSRGRLLITSPPPHAARRAPHPRATYTLHLYKQLGVLFRGHSRGHSRGHRPQCG
jgi:hypothetical protein